MSTVTSKDGTVIVYDQRGSGPALILVDGALGFRAFSGNSRLAELLAHHFTVYTYDRRGRGESGAAGLLTLASEVEDIDALIQAAGGAAYLYGISSGACLALEAAIHLGERVTKLALYEPPYDAEASAQPAWQAYRQRLAELGQADHRDEMVALFMRFVGVPDEQIDGMRQAPMWATLESVAPTLVADAEAIGTDRTPPLDRAARVQAPALLLDGGENLTVMPFMHATAQALAQVMPHAQQQTLAGQTHDVRQEVLAPVLELFFMQ